MAKAEITVGGKRYSLSCAPGQEARLEELGARFDQRVMELTEALGDLGAERLFLAAGISILDESLNIDWRIDPSKAILSEKDTNHPLLRDFDSPFEFRIPIKVY